MFIKYLTTYALQAKKLAKPGNEALPCPVTARHIFQFLLNPYFSLKNLLPLEFLQR